MRRFLTSAFLTAAAALVAAASPAPASPHVHGVEADAAGVFSMAGIEARAEKRHVDGRPGRALGDRTIVVAAADVVVRFEADATGAEMTGSLAPGESRRYALSARAGQDLYVRVAHRGGPRLDFQIFNPDGSFLLDMISTEREYRGELWQSGEHVVEVINRGGAPAEYSVIFGID